MSRKISKETEYKYHSDRVDPEEFNNRTMNLLKCVNTYFVVNSDMEILRKNLKGMDVNQVCKKPLDQLKEFVMSTGAGYTNVYAPVDSSLEALISSNLKRK